MCGRVYYKKVRLIINLVLYMKNILAKISVGATVALTPVLAFAQFDSAYLDDFFTSLTGWINTLLGLATAVAFLVFAWALIKYLYAAGKDPKAREDARGYMIWSVVILFVLVSVWGIVNLLQDFTGTTEQDIDAVIIPEVEDITP